MKFDFKVTAWERVTVADEDEQEVLDLIKKGEISTSQEIWNYLEKKGAEPITSKVIIGTEEQLSINDNGYRPTIYIIGDEDETIWDNVNGEQK